MNLSNFLKQNKDLALVFGLILILVVLFSPIPAVMLDLAILVNFGLGLTILLLTLYVKKPVEFSTFPSLLLIATLYRLSLNVAATRLILTGGDAGEVIDSIGSFAVRGEFIVGLVVFFILVVVQYVVVTSGAQRVSEVAARFTLDSMPGQQMSIDADLNMGLIDQDEARERRKALEKEAAFYGSMDGASKFVKGDSIAGVIIVLIDIIAGLIIGVAQMGMSWGEALETFTLLTIGDGIATQLPALIISIATGIIVTRSSADKELSAEVFKQLSSVQRIPLIVAGILCALLLLPGMPKWPIVFVVGLAIAFWLRIRKSGVDSDESDVDAESADKPQTSTAPPVLSIAWGSQLSTHWADQGEEALRRIDLVRQSHQKNLGYPLPTVRFLDGDRLGSNEYEFRVHGTRYASGEVEPDLLLAIESNETKGTIPGRATRDPTFGLPAIWIEKSREETAREMGYTIIDPLTVLITHFTEVVQAEADTLLSRSLTVSLLEDVRSRNPGLVEELVPNLLAIADIQKVLQALVAERVTIANIDLIVEHLADIARTEKNAGELAEQLRARLSYAICDQLRGRHRELSVLSLDPRLENQLLASRQRHPDAQQLPIEPKLADSLLRSLSAECDRMLGQGHNPVLLCSGELRRSLKALTARSVPRLSVLSITEIPKTIELKSFGLIQAGIDQTPSNLGSATSLGASAPKPAAG